MTELSGRTGGEIVLTRREQWQAAVARALCSLRPGIQRTVLGGRHRVDGDELDPGLRMALLLMRAGGQSSLIPGDPPDLPRAREELRRSATALSPSPLSVGAVTELEVEGAAGPLRARHYRPVAGAEPLPLLIYLHGGGFVLGDVDSYDATCRMLCRHAGVQVLAPEYRLAPEHPFPASTEDALAIWEWTLANAASLDADPDRLALGGDSAGGNLAAVAVQQLAQGAGTPPALQVLIYPGTDLARRHRSPLRAGLLPHRRRHRLVHGELSVGRRPSRSTGLPAARRGAVGRGAGGRRQRRIRSPARRGRGLRGGPTPSGRGGHGLPCPWHDPRFPRLRAAQPCRTP